MMAEAWIISKDLDLSSSLVKLMSCNLLSVVKIFLKVFFVLLLHYQTSKWCEEEQSRTFKSTVNINTIFIHCRSDACWKSIEALGTAVTSVWGWLTAHQHEWQVLGREPARGDEGRREYMFCHRLTRCKNVKRIYFTNVTFHKTHRECWIHGWYPGKM